MEPTPLKRKGGSWGPFLHDWGRVAIPAGVAVILAALRFTGILDDTGVGFAIGLVVLAGVAGAFGWIVWTNEFPRWVRPATIAMYALFAAGTVFPFVTTVYPGSPEGESVLVSKDKPEVSMGGVGSGHYVVEVYAQSLGEAGQPRGSEGQYRLLVGGEEVSGKFADVMRSVRAGRRGTRSVEQKHLMEVHNLDLPDGDKTVKVLRLDTTIGPDLRVTVYPAVVPPVVVYVVMGVILLFGVILDGLFQDQTEKWRLAPWMAVAAAFLLIFNSAYERGSVTSAAVWSAIIGGAAGFLAGWLLGLVSRKVMGRVRARI